jgi:hypothetical protein
MRGIRITPQEIADNIGYRLNKSAFISDSIDYKKDSFLFFYSGHLYKSTNENELRTSSSFETSFIHYTDSLEYNFSRKDLLINHITHLLAINDYSYNLSLVSQIRLFSIIKGVDFIRDNGKSKSFKEIRLISLSDDADQNDQWRIDYKTLKKRAPNKLDETQQMTTRYIYNQLNGKGMGVLEELYNDETQIPHIWIYNYKTFQSQPDYVVNHKPDLLEIKADDGKTIELTSLSRKYGVDSICFYYIDSIRINDSIYCPNLKFDHLWQNDIGFDNRLRLNKIQLYGYAQIQYIDSIYGEHYKKVYFTQTSQQISKCLQATIITFIVVLILVAVGLCCWFFLYLPNKKVFVIYDSDQKKKYVIKRGFKHEWIEGENPILCCIVHQEGASYIICKKHPRITERSFDLSGDDMQDRFIIESKDRLMSLHDLPSPIRSNRVEEFYVARSDNYSPSLKMLCQKRSKMDITKGKVYYYEIKRSYTGSIVYSLSGNKKNKLVFTIEIKNGINKSESSIYRQLSVECLNKYYADKMQYDALIGYCQYDINILTGNYLKGGLTYWIVLLPERQDVVSRRSLRIVCNVYQYKDLYVNDHTQIANKLKQLQDTIKKQLYMCKKIGNYQIQAPMSAISNPYNFELIEPTCPGFIYLMEDTYEKRKQLLYSPFADWSQPELRLDVKEIKNGHLYISFVPLKKTNKQDVSLYRRLSEELVSIDYLMSVRLVIKEQRITFYTLTDISI